MHTTSLVKFRAFCTAAVCLLGAMVAAQPLPLRNLQIEVRQVQSQSSERRGAQAQVGVQANASGAVRVDGAAQWVSQDSQQSGRAQQSSLVLNGRSTWVELGQWQPMRLLQTVQRNGQTLVVAGTVLLPARTGFSATPRWSGAEGVELEISTEQRLGQAPARSAASSVLRVPLDTWTTLAESELEGEDQGSGAGGIRRETTMQRTEVQVRISLR